MKMKTTKVTADLPNETRLRGQLGRKPPFAQLKPRLWAKFAAAALAAKKDQLGLKPDAPRGRLGALLGQAGPLS
ncbi:MAG: hypothetical protein LBU12_01945 [Deltaproteobacteria bacterium]|jgi:hypothetical protein|nr:hypothetical protein [Deltaproteobacteria bacterium]